MDKIADLKQRIDSLRADLASGEGGFAGDPYEVLEYMEDELRELEDELEQEQTKEGWKETS